MTPREIYDGSDGAATTALYERLTQFGAIGVIALNLFRASKCSARAKAYRGRGYKNDAYDRKNWSLENLNKALLEHAEILELKWGWGTDHLQPVHDKVLYIDLPQGQVSFHAATNFNCAQGYAGRWDGSGDSEKRIIRFVELVILSEQTMDVKETGASLAIAIRRYQMAIQRYVVRSAWADKEQAAIVGDGQSSPPDLDSSCGE